MSKITKDSKIYIAGHRGMVGSAIWRALELQGYTNLIGKTSKELDLRNQQMVYDFIQTEAPGYYRCNLALKFIIMITLITSSWRTCKSRIT